MAEARYLVSLAISDEAAVKAWAERCEQLGAVPPGRNGPNVAASLRLAVRLAESLSDDDVKRGYA
jgi:hypothetical protein